jgi:hypothetical protein
LASSMYIWHSTIEAGRIPGQGPLEQKPELSSTYLYRLT